MENRRYHSKLFTVVWKKNSLSKAFRGQDASCSVLQSFPKSFGLKLWVVGLCFTS